MKSILVSGQLNACHASSAADITGNRHGIQTLQSVATKRDAREKSDEDKTMDVMAKE